ncbi:hypothetical protein BDV25DRAFT_168393 [Aspergillus avenaceus]|uniref:Uncharacterized protein n=1 Tax=Aspergillus avenaceus TaxID=36643 RepID=A0A5N6TQC5_ASPAV|nr:hypothetical protein BDV25DRAFT_168393 [Aspergillus avenaceus]
MSDNDLALRIRDTRAWNMLAKKHGVENRSIHQLQRYSSASKITGPQYLALRAVWNFQRYGQFNPSEWGIKGVGTARTLLSKLPHLLEFLRQIPEKVPLDNIIPVDTNLGVLMLNWYYQQLILWGESYEDPESNLNFLAPATRARSQRSGGTSPPQTPTRPGASHGKALSDLVKQLKLGAAEGEPLSPNTADLLNSPETPFDDLEADPDYENTDPVDKGKFPRVSDENVVNSFLVYLANAITLPFNEIKGHWSQERKGFVVVIIEVKPMTRNESPRVMLQETAQIVAWIYAEPDNIQGKTRTERFRRFLLCQNRHEIYLVVADYDADYVDYVTNPGRDSECQSFLKMNQLGPWSIADPADIMTIATVILAMTMQFGNGETFI